MHFTEKLDDIMVLLKIRITEQEVTPAWQRLLRTRGERESWSLVILTEQDQELAKTIFKTIIHVTSQNVYEIFFVKEKSS